MVMKCSDEELLQVNARDKVVCLKTGQKSIPQRVAAALFLWNHIWIQIPFQKPIEGNNIFVIVLVGTRYWEKKTYRRSINVNNEQKNFNSLRKEDKKGEICFLRKKLSGGNIIT